MQILFPKNATRNQKLAIILLMLVAILTVIAILSGVLINEAVIFPLSIISIVASMVLIIVIIKAINNKESFVSKNWKSKGERPASLVIGAFLFVPLFMYPCISIGIPSALHMLVSKPDKIVVTVESKPSSFKRKYHSGGVYIEEYTYFMNNQIYGISKEDWDSLKSGDKILLEGNKSIFGFSYNQYEKLTKR